MSSGPTLPPAARRWLKHVLPAKFATGRPGCASNRRERWKSADRWTPFTAVGVYEGSPLSFNWKARLQVMPGVWIIAEDGQAKGEGWGGAKMWGLISMGRSTAQEVLVSQVVRNIGELAWLPELASADPDLLWTDAGKNAFEVRGQAGEREVMVRFELNKKGDIVRAHSPFRPYDVPGGFEEAPWTVEYSDHSDFDWHSDPGVGRGYVREGRRALGVFPRPGCWCEAGRRIIKDFADCTD